MVPSEFLEANQVPQAYGSVHSEALGVHSITTFSWVRDGATIPFEPADLLMADDYQGWSIELWSLKSSEVEARQWANNNGRRDAQQAFRAMVDSLRDAFPDGRPRRFMVYVFPADSRIDVAWPQWVTSENQLEMAFAGRLPSPDNTGESIDNFSLLLAHEYSHSYFWFHREHYKNNLSDEVVAYTVQRCLSEKLFGGSAGTVQPQEESVVRLVLGSSSSAAYRQLRSTYGDSYLGNLISAALIRRAEEDGTRDKLCHSVATDGTDYTR